MIIIVHQSAIHTRRSIRQRQTDSERGKSGSLIRARMSSRHDNNAVASIGRVCRCFTRTPIGQTERRPVIIDTVRFAIERPPEAVAQSYIVSELPGITPTYHSKSCHRT